MATNIQGNNTVNTFSFPKVDSVCGVLENAVKLHLIVLETFAYGLVAEFEPPRGGRKTTLLEENMWIEGINMTLMQESRDSLFERIRRTANNLYCTFELFRGQQGYIPKLSMKNIEFLPIDQEFVNLCKKRKVEL